MVYPQCTRRYHLNDKRKRTRLLERNIQKDKLTCPNKIMRDGVSEKKVKEDVRSMRRCKSSPHPLDARYKLLGNASKPKKKRNQMYSNKPRTPCRFFSIYFFLKRLLAASLI